MTEGDPLSEPWVDYPVAELAALWYGVAPETVDAVGRAAKALLAAQPREAVEDRRDLLPSHNATPSDLEVAAAVAWVLGQFKHRERALLLRRVLRLGKRSTLEDLGLQYGVTRERIRQIESAVNARLGAVLKKPEAAALVLLGRCWGTILGVEAPLEGGLSALGDLGRRSLEQGLEDTAHDVATAAVCLILQLAGPYRLEDGWLVLAYNDTATAGVRSALRAATSDGPAPFAEVREEIVACGIAEAFVDAAIARFAEFARYKDDVLFIGARLDDALYAYLLARCRPVTVDTAFDDLMKLRRPFAMTSLLNAAAGDERIVRRGNEIGLAEWGFKPGRTIVRALEEELSARGGTAATADLVEQLKREDGFAETSIRAYLSDPQFTRVGRGLVGLAPEGSRRAAPPTEELRLDLSPRCFLLDGVWAFRIPVTSETLRGSGMPLPIPVAQHLGINPGGSTTHDCDGAAIRLTWPHQQPLLGSVRTTAMALDAEVGDYLFLRFLADELVDARLTRPGRDAAVEGWPKLAAACGIDGAASAESWQHQVGRAIGLSQARCSDRSAIRDRLELRRNADLLALLPDDPQPSQHR